MEASASESLAQTDRPRVDMDDIEFMKRLMEAPGISNEDRVLFLKRFNAAKKTLSQAEESRRNISSRSVASSTEGVRYRTMPDSYAYPSMPIADAAWDPRMATAAPLPSIAYPPLPSAYAAPPDYWPAQWARGRVPHALRATPTLQERTDEMIDTLCCPCYTLTSLLRNAWRLLLLILSWGIVFVVGYVIWGVYKRF